MKTLVPTRIFFPALGPQTSTYIFPTSYAAEVNLHWRHISWLHLSILTSPCQHTWQLGIWVCQSVSSLSLQTPYREWRVLPCSEGKIFRKQQQFLVCTWRHGGYVGVQNNGDRSLLGIWFYYYAKLERHFAIVLYTNMSASSRECNLRITHIAALEPRFQWFERLIPLSTKLTSRASRFQ